MSTDLIKSTGYVLMWVLTLTSVSIYFLLEHKIPLVYWKKLFFCLTRFVWSYVFVPYNFGCLRKEGVRKYVRIGNRYDSL